MDWTSGRVDPVELDAAFDTLKTKDPVAFEVYHRRRFPSGSRPTLRELGEDMGLSHERIRQLEGRFSAALRSVAESPSHPIRQAASLLAERLGALARVEVLTGAVDEIGGETRALREEYRVRILLELAGPYEVDEKWCAHRLLIKEADDLLIHITGDGPVPLASAIQGLTELGMSPEDAETWLSLIKQYPIVEGHLVPRGRSMADRGISVLSIRGEPMTLDEIFATLNEKGSLRGFKNQMQGDDRVMRRGLKHYGLVEWGGEEYTTVADEMMQEIERRGGNANLDELADFLSRRFGISPNSVRMHAAGAQFIVYGDGRVAIASTSETPKTKPLPLTRDCFRLRLGWAFRRTVDPDVLRGSGSAIPLGFAKELGLTPTASLQLDTPFGPLTCSWPSHTAHIGSLRRVAETHSAVEGDYLFIVALDGGRANVFHIAATQWQGLTGIEQLASRCGCEGGTIEDVAAALGIDAGISGSPRIRARQQLLHRGEDELAKLIGDEDGLLEALVDL